MTATRLSLGIAIGVFALSGATAQTPLYRTKPLPPPPGEARQVIQPATASQVLTGEPDKLPPGPLPAGSVESPWVGGAPAGSYDTTVGGNGPLTYEWIGYTGPSFPILGGVLNNRLTVGWMVGTDARTLFFNPTQDAAWVLVLGYSYVFNKGQNDLHNALDVATPRDRQAIDPVTGQPRFDANFNPIIERNPIDGIGRYTVHSFHRQTVNFGIGRDWWLNGPATVGCASPSNWRVGAEAGGRWGTGHINLQVADPADRGNHLRRAGVHHGFYLGTSVTYERSFGNAILYTGLRGQWGYNWMNYVLPQDGDTQDLNLLLTCGVRF
jgi:hypothetical protein